MRIVFCGSGEVAAVTLSALCAEGYDIPLVVTQPPRKAGRGGKLTATPVSDRAGELGVATVSTHNINEPEQVQLIRQLSPEALVVVDFGQMIGRTLREIPRHGALNMHASLLPALRGAAPINWAILHGLTETGVTTFRLVKEVDAGPLLMQASLEIEPAETAEQLRARLADLGAEVVIDTLKGLEAGTITPVEQDHSLATFAPKMNKRTGAVDFAGSAIDVVNRIRGTWPWPGAHADFVRGEGKPVRVIFARARAMITAEPNPAQPGSVAEDLTVNTPDGAVEILELKVAGKRLMGWKDFVNGYRVSPGDRFVFVGGKPNE